jgi:hypothetical protein
MKLPLLRLGLVLAFLGMTPMRAGEVSPVTPAADGTYTVTAKATHKFTRNTEKLKTEAMKAAEEFCAKEGKQLKVVSMTENRSMYLMGDFARVTLTFKALDAAAMEPAATAAAPAPKHLSTDELEAELTKLDAMRKKGLLSDAEFDALKQKLLSRY